MCYETVDNTNASIDFQHPMVRAQWKCVMTKFVTIGIYDGWFISSSIWPVNHRFGSPEVPLNSLSPKLVVLRYSQVSTTTGYKLQDVSRTLDG